MNIGPQQENLDANVFTKRLPFKQFIKFQKLIKIFKKIIIFLQPLGFRTLFYQLLVYFARQQENKFNPNIPIEKLRLIWVNQFHSSDTDTQLVK